MKFISPSQGEMNLATVYESIRAYIDQDPSKQYRLIIGTDSQVRRYIVFVTAIIIHRVGKGARYFYCKTQDRAMASLRQRMYYETSLSLDIASRLTSLMAHDQESSILGLEIHLDIGTSGDTRGLIKELVGMVIGSGFSARIKPYSFGASTVADKHTKG